MNSKEYRELIRVYQNICEQKIGVPLDKPTDDAAARKLQQMIPKGEKVYIPKSGLQKAHYEPEGEQLQEKPGDGYIGLKNEQNQGPSTPVKIDPKMGVVPNQGAGRVGQVRLKPGTPASSLIKPVDEQQVINPPKSGGLEFPFRSVDGLIRGGAASGIPDIPDNIKRTKQNMDALKQGMVKKQTPKPTTQVAHLDLFDIVKGYLLDEGYVTTEEEALYMMSNMSEETIQDIIEAAVQPSLITSKGKAQNFTKPNRVPFTSSKPVPTRSTTQATPPRRPPGGFGNKPAGQLKLDLNKPAAKPVAKPAAKPVAKPAAKPVATQQRSQQFRDVQRLNKTTGGGVMGTTKPTNLEPRAPKPAWKPTTKPAATSTKPTTTATKPAAKPTTTSTKPNPYRPGATVRATGPNMDKFPQLQRFANQARKVAEPVSKVAGAVAALRNITPAGVAAAVMAPRPTGDATLKGALKSGTYKPKQGPANPDQGLTKAQSFDKSFKAARKSGKSGFTWNNKTYTTKIKESFDDFDLIQDYLISEGYADNVKAASAIVENMSEDWIDIVLEDLEERRRQLMQRQKQQVTASQERVASYQQARRKKRKKAQEKEQLKNELRKELRREAVGDSIKPENVISLDAESQKNLRSTMKPSGPAPMKPAAPKTKQSSSDRSSDRFVKRMVGSTMLSPL